MKSGRTFLKKYFCDFYKDLLLNVNDNIIEALDVDFILDACFGMLISNKSSIKRVDKHLKAMEVLKILQNK